ncbi:hypothetical protein [Sorangium sp. So ce542]|uniref:hypothetical protein n=1 Tax=Sorangium sp. So ce542 TaxID=3133316 RepID=UPI003F5EDF2C
MLTGIDPFNNGRWSRAMPNADVTSEFKTTLEKLLDAGYSILVEEGDYQSLSIPVIWGMTHAGGEVRRSRVDGIRLIALSIPRRTEPVRLRGLTQGQREELVGSLKVLAEESLKESLKKNGGCGTGKWIGIEDEHRSISTNRPDFGSRTRLGLDSPVRFRFDAPVVDDGIHADKSLFMVQAYCWVDPNKNR